MSPPLLELEDVCRAFPSPAGPISVLRRVRLTVTPGERIVLLGPSGSGKTTLLHLIALLDRPDAGTLRWEGEDTGTWDESARCRHRARHIGLVFQNFHCLPRRSVRDNLRLRFGVDSPADPAREDELLDRIGLLERANHPARLLSGGERQRLCIARAVLPHPRLLLADEPTGNLDDASAARVRELFESFSTPDRAVIVATHDPRWIPFASRVIRLEELQSPTPAAAVSPHSGHRFPRPPRAALPFACLAAALLLGFGLDLHHRAASQTRELLRAWPPRSCTLRFASPPHPADLARILSLLPSGSVLGLRSEGRNLWIDGFPNFANDSIDLIREGRRVVWISPERAATHRLRPGDLMDHGGGLFRIQGIHDGSFDAEVIAPWRASDLPAPETWRVALPAAQVAPLLQAAEFSGGELSLTDHDARRKEVEGPLRRLRTLLAGLGAVVALLVALVVGALLGADVRERRSEIGLRRALGASPRDILLLFLRETAGVGAAAAGAGLLPWMLVVPPAQVLAALGILLLWIILNALLPSARAAALPPSETLRGA